MKYTYHAHAICQLPNNSIQHFDGIVLWMEEIDHINYKELKKAIAADMGVKEGEESKVVIDSLTFLYKEEDNG